MGLSTKTGTAISWIRETVGGIGVFLKAAAADVVGILIGTSKHRIYDNSGDLVITNVTNNKDINILAAGTGTADVNIAAVQDINLAAGVQVTGIVAGTGEINLETGVIYPETDNALDLGKTTTRFKDVYIIGKYRVYSGTNYTDIVHGQISTNDSTQPIKLFSGANQVFYAYATSTQIQNGSSWILRIGSSKFQFLYNGTNSVIDVQQTKITPGTDNTVDLGDTTPLYFKDIYYKGKLYVGTTLEAIYLSSGNLYIDALTAGKSVRYRGKDGHYFYIDTTSIWTMGTSNLLPGADNTNDIGSTTKTLKDIYYKGYVYIGTTADYLRNNGGDIELVVGTASKNLKLSATGSIVVNTTVVSDTDNTDDLGTAAAGFKDVYYKGVLYVGANGQLYESGVDSILTNITGSVIFDSPISVILRFNTVAAITVDSNGVKVESDLYFSGAGSGLPFGSCYGNDIAWSQAAAVQNTWYNISDADMTDGELNAVTHDGNGKLTVLKAGRYLINYSIDLDGSVANDHYESGIEIDGSGSDISQGRTHVSGVSANADNPLAGTAIVNLAANATIEVCVRTTDANTPTITVDHLTITVVQVGG